MPAPADPSQSSSLRRSSVSGPAEHTVPVSGALYVDELFDQIAALPVADRESALAERCLGHPSVEAEVRALLRAVEGEPEPPSPIRIAAGAQVGRYRLEQRLGSGATASVWKAFDLHLHSFTALKLLHPDGRIRGQMALDAVMREARAASGIISDHVVRIKTAGRFEGGPHFLEMELCAETRPGPHGSEVLEIGRTLAEADLQSVQEAVRVVAEAARGVEAAHRAGVLHRDLKPGNILLTPVGRRAKVTDFGLAADQIFPEPTEDTPPTATVTVQLEAREGRIVGTPAYMSPEQALGHPPTRTGDVYALGATLWALVARRAPYEPNGGHAIAAFDVLAQVRAGPPPRLDEVVRVPRRLARMVAKAMARSARDRYPTAADFATDLERWLDRRTTSVDGAAPLLRIALFARRNRELVASAVALLAVLVVFAGAVGWLNVQRADLLVSISQAERRKLDAEHAATQAAALRDRTTLEKEQALSEAQAANVARQVALSGQSDAEARARDEMAKRAEAEAARMQAELDRAEAEAGRAGMELERDAAISARERADARTALAEEAEQAANERAAAESQARLDAQQAALDLERAVETREQQIAQLEEGIERERTARAEAEAEVSRLQAELRSLREAVPGP